MRSTDGLTELQSYAATGVKERPVPDEYSAGVIAGEDLPEAWWNYLWNVITTNSDMTKDRLNNLLTELSTVLASSGLTPNGAGAATQVDEALKIKYMSRVGIPVTDFDAIVTSSLPQGSVSPFYADAGFTNGPAGATRYTGFIVRAKIAQDDAMVIAYGNVAGVGVGVNPVAVRIRSAGVWSAWAYNLTTNNATSAATASTVVTRDGAGRTKMAEPAAADDVAVLKTVTDHNAVVSAHSATSAATADRIVLRDANGRAKVAMPAADDDIARSDTTVAPHAVVKLTSGSGNWVVPAGVSRLKVICVGGGGGGNGGYNTICGAGGGGTIICDALAEILSVTPGQTIAYSVGAGGTPGAGQTLANPGGTTTFGGLSAQGGQASGSTYWNVPGLGSPGGAGAPGLNPNGSAQGGHGGAAGGRGYISTSPGHAPTAAGFGGGGGGGAVGGSGSAGGSGIIIIEY